MEAALSKRWITRTGYHSPRPTAEQTDSGAASQGAGSNQTSPARWIDPLVVAKNGCGYEGEQEFNRADLARGGPQAASAGALHGIQRSAV